MADTAGAADTPRQPDPGTLHAALIDGLVRDGHIASAAVEAAFRATRRQIFLLDVALERVYRDEAIPTHEQDGVPVSSSSQPAAMAIMLEQLGVRPGERVLEIGAGTGYNAALLARLAGPEGRVVTVDLDEEIVAEARAHLAAAGLPDVLVVSGDGGAGYPPGAPYDRIELTVGAWDIAPAWWEQLAPGGRLLAPLWLRGAQVTVAFERAVDAAGQAHLASAGVSDCAFMRLRSAFAGPEGFVAFGPERGLVLGVDDRSGVEPEALARVVAAPAFELAADVPVETGIGFALWLALHDPAYCHLSDDRPEPVLAESARFLLVAPGYRFTIGLLRDEALCLILLPSGDSGGDGGLRIRCYGQDRDAARRLGERCRSHLAAWQAAGRPTSKTLRMRVYPLGVEPSPPSQVMIAKRWHALAIDWGR